MATKASKPKKSTKKPASKTTAKAKSPVLSQAVVKTESVRSSARTLKLRRAYVVLLVVIIALGALLYYARGVFVAAVVNGQPISRLSVVREAEKQSGKQSLETIIRNTLVEQEAKKLNVTVSDQ